MAWGNKHITKNVDVRPLVWLSFRADKVAGSVATAADVGYRYLIANESVKAFSIHATIGKPGDADHRKFTLARKSSVKPKRPYFSRKHATFSLRPHHAADLNELFAAKDAGKLTTTITLEVAYGLFSEYILDYVARSSSDGGEYHNIGNPAPGDEIKKLDNELVKLWHSKDFMKKHASRTRYKFAKKKNRIVGPIPCLLSGRDVDNATARPGVKLYFFLAVHKLKPAERDRVTRMFVAADHYKLIKYATERNSTGFPFDITFHSSAGPGRFDISGARHQRVGGSWTHLGPYARFVEEGDGATSLQKVIRVWRKNVTTYFVNYVDVDRGKKIRAKLVSTARTLAADSTMTQTKLVMGVRDEIDKYLITANHWHGSREVFKKTKSLRRLEVHQHILSDTFGEIHGKTYYGGSPVHYVRRVPAQPVWWKYDGVTNWWSGSIIYWLSVKNRSWTDEEKVAYCLQVGAGHCGEHAAVCFSVIREAMLDPKVKSLARNIILSGNANIDHAFCVVGMHAKVIYHDIRSKNWGRKVRRDGSIDWKRKTGQSLVLWDLKKAIGDGQSGVVMDAYLGDLQRKTPKGLLKKIKRKEGTHYLSFRGQHPLAGTDNRAGLPDI